MEIQTGQIHALFHELRKVLEKRSLVRFHPHSFSIYERVDFEVNSNGYTLTIPPAAGNQQTSICFEILDALSAQIYLLSSDRLRNVGEEELSISLNAKAHRTKDGEVCIKVITGDLTVPENHTSLMTHLIDARRKCSVTIDKYKDNPWVHRVSELVNLESAPSRAPGSDSKSVLELLNMFALGTFADSQMKNVWGRDITIRSSATKADSFLRSTFTTEFGNISEQDLEKVRDLAASLSHIVSDAAESAELARTVSYEYDEKHQTASIRLSGNSPRLLKELKTGMKSLPVYAKISDFVNGPAPAVARA